MGQNCLRTDARRRDESVSPEFGWLPMSTQGTPLPRTTWLRQVNSLSRAYSGLSKTACPLRSLSIRKSICLNSTPKRPRNTQAKVQISADGREMLNYVAGLPFPNIDPNDPLAGAKIMWNQEQKPSYVDNVGTEWIMELVNNRGEMERMYGSQFWRRMMWEPVVCTPTPKPIVPNNPPMRYTEQFWSAFYSQRPEGRWRGSIRAICQRTFRMTPICICLSCVVCVVSASQNRSDAFLGHGHGSRLPVGA